MADVIVLDKERVNEVMEPEDLSEQTMYELTIPANTLGVDSRLRIKLVLSRAVGVPLPGPDFACNICHEAALPGAQELSEVRTIIANPQAVSGSFAHVGELNGGVEIFQAEYANDFAYAGETFDQNRNWQLYIIREGDAIQTAKILTTTADDLNGGSTAVGIADEPAYGIVFGVSFFSNAPSGLYLYLPDRKVQAYIPVSGTSYFTLLDGMVYIFSDTGLSPSDTLYKYDLAGGLQGSSTDLRDFGYTNTRAYQAFGSSLYVLSQDTIFKMSLESLTIEAFYPLARTPCRSLAVVSENLIYFTYGDIAVAYLTTGDGHVTDVDTNITKTTSFTYNDGNVFPIKYSLHFQKIGNNPGYLYLGGAGPTIIKIGPIGCV